MTIGRKYNMLIFEPDNFENNYNSFLKSGSPRDMYIDPDCVQDISKTGYYNYLTVFLNKREIENNGEYLFLPPIDSKLTKANEHNGKKFDDKKISVYKNNELVFRVTSDQYGFSAAENIYEDERYFLSSIINRLHNLSIDKQQCIRKIVTKFVLHSRTLGGAFVWPLPKIGRRTCHYNCARGISSYIEDSVDLTLWEIKHALDGEYDKCNYISDILYNEYKKNGIMKGWLNHFGNFEKFIDYFMLEDFIIEGDPIDITTGEKLQERTVNEYKEEFVNNKRRLATLPLDDGLAVLERLEGMILSRTKKIEEYIKQDIEKIYSVNTTIK